MRCRSPVAVEQSFSVSAGRQVWRWLGRHRLMNLAKFKVPETQQKWRASEVKGPASGLSAARVGKKRGLGHAIRAERPAKRRVTSLSLTEEVEEIESPSPKWRKTRRRKREEQPPKKSKYGITPIYLDDDDDEKEAEEIVLLDASPLPSRPPLSRRTHRDLPLKKGQMEDNRRSNLRCITNHSQVTARSCGAMPSAASSSPPHLPSSLELEESPESPDDDFLCGKESSLSQELWESQEESLPFESSPGSSAEEPKDWANAENRRAGGNRIVSLLEDSPRRSPRRHRSSLDRDAARRASQASQQPSQGTQRKRFIVSSSSDAARRSDGRREYRFRSDASPTGVQKQTRTAAAAAVGRPPLSPVIDPAFAKLPIARRSKIRRLSRAPLLRSLLSD